MTSDMYTRMIRRAEGLARTGDSDQNVRWLLVAIYLRLRRHRHRAGY